MNPDDFTITRIVDREIIRHQICRWCRAVDRLDYDEIRSVFHENAVDSHGFFVGPIPDLIEWISKRHENITFSLHMVGNILIEFTGPDSALVETYIVAVQRNAPNAAGKVAIFGSEDEVTNHAKDILAFGRYVDHFDRETGEWRIRHRQVVSEPVLIFDAPTNHEFDTTLHQLVIAQRGAGDHIYKVRQEAGIAPAKG